MNINKHFKQFLTDNHKQFKEQLKLNNILTYEQKYIILNTYFNETVDEKIPCICCIKNNVFYILKIEKSFDYDYKDEDGNDNHSDDLNFKPNENSFSISCYIYIFINNYFIEKIVSVINNKNIGDYYFYTIQSYKRECYNDNDEEFITDEEAEDDEEEDNTDEEDEEDEKDEKDEKDDEEEDNTDEEDEKDDADNDEEEDNADNTDEEDNTDIDYEDLDGFNDDDDIISEIHGISEHINRVNDKIEMKIIVYTPNELIKLDTGTFNFDSKNEYDKEMEQVLQKFAELDIDDIMMEQFVQYNKFIEELFNYVLLSDNNDNAANKYKNKICKHGESQFMF